jgi:hypothetical protein
MDREKEKIYLPLTTFIDETVGKMLVYPWALRKLKLKAPSHKALTNDN